MIELQCILLAVFAISMILYCIFFHEKSLHFILSVSWFFVNIVQLSSSIYINLSLHSILSNNINNHLRVYSTIELTSSVLALLYFFLLLKSAKLFSGYLNDSYNSFVEVILFVFLNVLIISICSL